MTIISGKIVCPFGSFLFLIMLLREKTVRKSLIFMKNRRKRYVLKEEKDCGAIVARLSG